jgi:hypothetical protein
MQVDFLAGEYGGNAKSHRHQRVQDLLGHKARGADMVFDQCYPEDLKGRMLLVVGTDQTAPSHEYDHPDAARCPPTQTGHSALGQSPSR